MDVPVYTMKGESSGSMTIDEAALGGVVNPALIKQAYVRYHANLRQGSARSLNRGEVSGSRKKLYKQKGTGRARHGSKRPPQFRGGGHWKSSRRTREDFRLDMPKKMRRKANLNALLAKLLGSEVDGTKVQEVRVIDSIAMATPKTKDFRDFMAALGIDGSVLVAMSSDPSKSDAARKSARNIDGVTLCRADQLTCFEMLNHRYLVIGKEELEAWLAGPSAQFDKSAKTEPKGRGVSAKAEAKPRPKRGHAVKAAAWAAKRGGGEG
jgi:large subunit ribosomal protein L4